MDIFSLYGTPIIIVPDVVIQNRTHKKKRINKKWKKLYGVSIHKRIKDGETLLCDGKMYMNEYTYTKMHKYLLKK